MKRISAIMNNLRHSLNTFWRRGSYWPLSEPFSMWLSCRTNSTITPSFPYVYLQSPKVPIQKLLGTHSDLWPQITHVDIQLHSTYPCLQVFVYVLTFLLDYFIVSL